MSGIDFEPDRPDQRLVNCTLRDCSFYDNNATRYSSGIHTHVGYLDHTSQPVSINIERCHITSTRSSASAVTLKGKDKNGPIVNYVMTDCLIEDTRGCGLLIKSPLPTTSVQITRTVLRNTYTDTPTWGGAPIYFEGQDSNYDAYGNITFTDCLVSDTRARSFIRSYEGRTGFAETYCNGLRGNITVVNPNAVGHTWKLGNSSNDLNITLAVTALTAMPTQTIDLASVVPACAEGGTPASFNLTRTAADTSFPLAVNFTWSGTATSLLDYGLSPGFHILPPRITFGNIALTARTDNLSEAEIGETAIATLTARSADYILSGITGASSNTLQIFDTPLPAWRFNALGSSADTGIAANFADPDGDSMVNLLEYALGGNPTSAASAPTPVIANPGNGLRLTFMRARSDLTYTVQGTNDLTTAWANLSTNPGTVGGNVTFTDAPTSSNHRFLRVRVSLP